VGYVEGLWFSTNATISDGEHLLLLRLQASFLKLALFPAGLTRETSIFDEVAIKITAVAGIRFKFSHLLLKRIRDFVRKLIGVIAPRRKILSQLLPDLPDPLYEPLGELILFEFGAHHLDDFIPKS